MKKPNAAIRDANAALEVRFAYFVNCITLFSIFLKRNNI